MTDSASVPQVVSTGKRIAGSSRLNCLNHTRRIDRPFEYLKVPDLNASTGQVEPAGHTNTTKFPAHLPTTGQVVPAGHSNTSKFLPQLPPTDKSNRQAIRILQSRPLNCLNRTSRTGGPYEYFKAARSFAYNRTSRTGGPYEYFKAARSIAYNRTSRTGGPHEYFKTARSFAYNRQVVPAGHTNTSKFQT